MYVQIRITVPAFEAGVASSSLYTILMTVLYCGYSNREC